MKKEKNNLLIDTRHISNVKKNFNLTNRIATITYVVDLTLFDYGTIANITDVYLQWINMNSSNWLPGNQEYVYLNIFELGDRIISNGTKQRSSFVIPTSSRSLIFMTDALGNHIHYPEPIYKLDKLTIELSWLHNSDTYNIDTHDHSMLLTFESNREREY